MKELDRITYELVLNIMMREINRKFIRENIERITMSEIPLKIKEKGNYVWFDKAYESECNYNREKERIHREMYKSQCIMN